MPDNGMYEPDVKKFLWSKGYRNKPEIDKLTELINRYINSTKKFEIVKHTYVFDNITRKLEDKHGYRYTYRSYKTKEAAEAALRAHRSHQSKWTYQNRTWLYRYKIKFNEIRAEKEYVDDGTVCINSLCFPVGFFSTDQLDLVHRLMATAAEKARREESKRCLIKVPDWVKT